jgi:hypothetical protein
MPFSVSMSFFLLTKGAAGAPLVAANHSKPPGRSRTGIGRSWRRGCEASAVVSENHAINLLEKGGQVFDSKSSEKIWRAESEYPADSWYT